MSAGVPPRSAGRNRPSDGASRDHDGRSGRYDRSTVGSAQQAATVALGAAGRGESPVVDQLGRAVAVVDSGDSNPAKTSECTLLHAGVPSASARARATGHTTEASSAPAQSAADPAEAS